MSEIKSVEPQSNRITIIIRRDTRHYFSLHTQTKSTYEHIARWQSPTSQEVSPQLESTSTLIWPPELLEDKFLLFKPPSLLSDFLWQPKQTIIPQNKQSKREHPKIEVTVFL